MSTQPRPPQPDAGVDLAPYIGWIDYFLAHQEEMIEHTRKLGHDVEIRWVWAGDNNGDWLRIQGPQYIVALLLQAYRDAGYTKDQAWSTDPTIMTIKPARR